MYPPIHARCARSIVRWSVFIGVWLFSVALFAQNSPLRTSPIPAHLQADYHPSPLHSAQVSHPLDLFAQGYTRRPSTETGVFVRFYFPIPDASEHTKGLLEITLLTLPRSGQIRRYRLDSPDWKVSYSEWRGNRSIFDGSLTSGDLVISSSEIHREILRAGQGHFWLDFTDTKRKESRRFTLGRLVFDDALTLPSPSATSSTSKTPSRETPSAPQTKSPSSNALPPVGLGGGIAIDDLPTEGCGGEDPILDQKESDPAEKSGCEEGDPILDGDKSGGGDSGCGKSEGGSGLDCDDSPARQQMHPARQQTHPARRASLRRQRAKDAMLYFASIPFLWLCWLRIQRRNRYPRHQQQNRSDDEPDLPTLPR